MGLSQDPINDDRYCGKRRQGSAARSLHPGKGRLKAGMYGDFFKFRELPFNNTPDPRFFYSTPDYEEALATLVYATRERKGFALLTGEVGTGKTLLTRMMLRQFRTRVSFATINHAVANPQDLMESICTEFELSYPAGATQTQLVRRLHDFLLTQFAQNLPVVLILDEAQNLPTEAFEQLRMIGNLEADDAKLLQIVIVGQPELRYRFRSPQMRQLSQRLFRSFHLPALDCSHAEKYIQHRLSVVSDDDAESIFAPDALAVIYQASKGLPRLINTICDNALLSAYSADRKTIDGPFVESVLRQLMLDTDPVARAPDLAYASPPYVEFPSPAVASSRESVAENPPIRNRRIDDSYGTNPRRTYQDAPRISLEEPRSISSHASTEILSSIHELGLRVHHMEHCLVDRTPKLSQIQQAQSTLTPLVQQAETTTERLRATSQFVLKKEHRLRKLNESVRSVLRDLQYALERTQRATQEASCAERNARATQKALDRLTALKSRGVTNYRADKRSASAASTTPPSEAPQRKTGNRVGPPKTARSTPAPARSGHVSRLLKTARESLADLSKLADGPSSAVRLELSDGAPPDKYGTSKLERDVCELAALMEPA